jgi:hypothetical protein
MISMYFPTQMPLVPVDDLATYTKWCDEDVKVVEVLFWSVQPQFAYEFMSLSTVYKM